MLRMPLNACHSTEGLGKLLSDMNQKNLKCEETVNLMAAKNWVVSCISFFALPVRTSVSNSATIRDLRP